MPTRKGAALSEFHQSVYQATSTKAFAEKFQKLCQNFDRHGMIRLIAELDRVKKLKIDESYDGKNDSEARKIYEKFRDIAGETGKRGILLKINVLNRALFAANPKTPLFAQILLSRARCWYCIGALYRCIKDCDYLLTITTTSDSLNTEEKSQNNDERIECVAIKTKCEERLKLGKKNFQKHSNKNSSAFSVLPKFYGRQNAKLRSCSDAVSVAHDQTRGRHLTATRNIRTGSVLIIDRPFAVSTDGHALKTNCLHCHVSLDRDDNVSFPCNNCQTVAFCSNECRQNSWDNYHKYECTIFDYFYETNVRDIDEAHEHRSHLLLAWRTTIAKALDKSTNRLTDEFLCYQEFVSNEEKGKRNVDATINPYDPLDYRTVFALETHCADAPFHVNLARSLKAIFLAKCMDFVLSKLRGSKLRTIEEKDLILVAVGILRHVQAVDCNAYEIVENCRDERTKIWTPRNIGGAIYTTVSLVNHGCYPNVVRHTYPEGKVVVRALRFIPKGSEILDCYGPHFVNDSCSSRRRYLLEKYNFVCACEACTNDWQLPDDNVASYRCSSCGNSPPEATSRCSKCGKTIDRKKLESQLAKSTKKRVAAIGKMFDGNYVDALPNLLEHADVVDKILAMPSVEAIKTQQSIVQCYNSLGSTGPSNDVSTSDVD